MNIYNKNIFGVNTFFLQEQGLIQIFREPFNDTVLIWFGTFFNFIDDFANRLIFD